MSEIPTSGSGPRPIEVGDTLGQYKLVELIAVGGMGMVYRGFDKALERFVAIKVLAPHLAQEPGVARRFLNEARAAAALNHPNIVHIYNAGECEGNFYFAMELVDGEHLEALLARRRRLPPKEAVEFVRQAAVGLQHAHEHGLIHGDVKPANFLVTTGEVLKVTDFGLARHVRSGKTDGDGQFGTPGYISPEIINGGTPDHRSDIYALGATLYQMLTGQPPHAGGDPDEVLRRHLEERIPSVQELVPSIPAALEKIVSRMLAKNPADRYGSYSELLRALEWYREGRLAVGSATEPRFKTGPWLKEQAVANKPEAARPSPRRVMVSLLITLLALVACGVIVFLVYKTHFAGPPVQPAPVSHQPPVVQPPVPPPPPPPPPTTVVQPPEPPKHVEPKPDNTTRLDAVREKWGKAKLEIERLRVANKFQEALGVCERLEPVVHGVPGLEFEWRELRQQLEGARQAYEADLAARQAAAEKARQEILQRWRTQLDVHILSFHWEEGRQAVQQAAAEAKGDAVLKTAVAQHQQIMDSLLAMQAGLTQRLKRGPGPTVAVTVQRNETKGQVSGVDPEQIVLRQSVGEFGFSEVTIRWSDLAPVGLARFWAACHDAGNAAETLGYAVLLATQALANHGPVDEARQALQAAAKFPAQAAIAQDYLSQLAAWEKYQQEVQAGARPEAEAKQLWELLELQRKQLKWAKAAELMVRLAGEYGQTAFIKGKLDEMQKISTEIRDHTSQQRFIPLDIGDACNAGLLKEDGFRRGVHVTGYPQDGRIQLRDTTPTGVFQLRTAERYDGIGLSAEDGRFASSASMKIPITKRRRYSHLAILSASSVGTASVKVRVTFESGDMSEATLKVYELTSRRNTDGANIACEVSTGRGDRPAGRLYLDVFELKSESPISAITLTWAGAAGRNPGHCVGIFAISGVPVD